MKATYTLCPVESHGGVEFEISSLRALHYEARHTTQESAEAEARRFLALPDAQRGQRVVGVSVYCENPKARRKADRRVCVASLNR